MCAYAVASVCVATLAYIIKCIHLLVASRIAFALNCNEFSEFSACHCPPPSFTAHSPPSAIDGAKLFGIFFWPSAKCISTLFIVNDLLLSGRNRRLR